jgi:uncharacterized protein YjiS (DUF1127 family)
MIGRQNWSQRLIAIAGLWRQRRRLRKELDLLADHSFADLGVSRNHLERRVDDWFWGEWDRQLYAGMRNRRIDTVRQRESAF